MTLITQENAQTQNLNQTVLSQWDTSGLFFSELYTVGLVL